MSYMKNIKPNKTGKFKQSYFTAKNPHKYHGDPSKIIYRSSWEHRFMSWCDLHPSIVKWASEPVGIPYISPLDERHHMYYVDFWVLVEKDGAKKQYLIEIKPSVQTKPPAQTLISKVNEGAATTAQIKRFNRELRTYIVNKAKFQAAHEYAINRGMEFQVCTENFLF